LQRLPHLPPHDGELLSGFLASPQEQFHPGPARAAAWVRPILGQGDAQCLTHPTKLRLPQNFGPPQNMTRWPPRFIANCGTPAPLAAHVNWPPRGPWSTAWKPLFKNVLRMPTWSARFAKGLVSWSTRGRVITTRKAAESTLMTA